jgi:N-acyl-D-amino-acid deacylase
VFDLVIRGGTIVDGSRKKGYSADIGIQGDKISAIGKIESNQGQRVIDATGKVVAPGFVDTHNHSDAWLLKTPHLYSKTSQGFTSEVIMADGISYAPVQRGNIYEWIYYLRGLNALRYEEYKGWESLGEYMAQLDRKNVQNSITHIPYANVRVNACGFGRAQPDDFQMRAMRREVEQGIEQGAVGLSTGLDYIVQCWASTDELVEVSKPLAQVQGLYVTHMRYKMGTLQALQEAVEIGKRAGVPVHISHLKGTTPGDIEAILNYIDTVAVHEVDFSFDVYPYLPGSTMLNYLLPYDVWDTGPIGVVERLRRPDVRARFAKSLEHLRLDATHIAWVAGKENSKHQGKMLSEYVDEVGLEPVDALLNLLIEENLAVLLVMHQGDDDLIEPFLAHEKYMIGTDGIYHEDGAVHPRQYGSTGRILGTWVRERQRLSLEDAIYKLAGYPAERFGLANRGQLREGWFADVVVFDAIQIQDRATFENPHQVNSGMEHVIVNGVAIVQNGDPNEELTGPLPGRALRFKKE